MANKEAVAEVAEKKPADEIAELKERVAKLEGLIFEHMSRWGTFYDSQGYSAPFFAHEFITSGVNGLVLSARQGAFQMMGVPLKLPLTAAEKKTGKRIEGPCWVPDYIPPAEPEKNEEEFGEDGADNKAVAQA